MRSISSGSIKTTEQHASFKIRSFWTLRCDSVSFFESSRPSTSKSSGRITAATTKGPAKAPRPTSSTPAAPLTASSRPEVLISACHNSSSKAASVAQLVRAPDCDSGGRGFKSRYSPQTLSSKFPTRFAYSPGNKYLFFFAPFSSANLVPNLADLSGIWLPTVKV